jgi:Uma2 family endonuclease
MATITTRIGPADHGRRMTLDEFREAEEEPGYLYELARGVLEVSEVPADDHGQIVDNVHEALSRYRHEHPNEILRLAHGSDVRLLIPQLDSDRHPDLGVVFRGAPLNSRGRQVPALVVEVASPGREAHHRDYHEKREEYLTISISEYWIIDPQTRQVTVLYREGDIWVERVFQGDQTIESRVLPGFAGRVADLWVDVAADPDGNT